MRGVEPLTPQPGLGPADRVVGGADADAAGKQRAEGRGIAGQRGRREPVLRGLECPLEDGCPLLWRPARRIGDVERGPKAATASGQRSFQNGYSTASGTTSPRCMAATAWPTPGRSMSGLTRGSVNCPWAVIQKITSVRRAAARAIRKNRADPRHVPGSMPRNPIRSRNLYFPSAAASIGP